MPSISYELYMIRCTRAAALLIPTTKAHRAYGFACLTSDYIIRHLTFMAEKNAGFVIHM